MKTGLTSTLAFVTGFHNLIIYTLNNDQNLGNT